MLYELKNIRKASGLSQAEAAKKFDVPLGTYRNWEQCIYMPRDNSTIKKIADYFDVSMEALFGYDLVSPGAFSDLPEEQNAKMKYVPLVAEIAAGMPIESDEILDFIPIPNEVMRKHPTAYLLRINGTSMNRVLPDGCYALVDPAMKDVVDGHAYAVKVNGDASTAKRIKRLANGVELIPDSLDPTHKPIVFDKEDESKWKELKIEGEIVWYTIPFDFQI